MENLAIVDNLRLTKLSTISRVHCIYNIMRGHRELSGHLGRKEGGQHWAYANLWFLRLNIVETFRKHFPDVKNILLVAREAIVTKIRLLCPQK